jgi:uncharacterized membrane protein YeiH
MLPIVVDWIAVGVFAISGCLAAGRRQLDLMGVLIIAVVSAVGGSTVRDLLLNRHPIVWIADPIFLYIIFGAVAITYLFLRGRRPPQQLLLLVDAVGLSLYSIVGAYTTEQAGHTGIVAVVMGTLTATAGGLLRDILCNEVPLLLKGKYLYASAAMSGAACYVLLHNLEVPQWWAALLGMGMVATLRLGSILYEWNLPILKIDDEWKGI